jgi:hypothetical protein
MLNWVPNGGLTVRKEFEIPVEETVSLPSSTTKGKRVS